MISSVISGFPANSRAAVASPFAFRARVRDTSVRSSADEDTPFSQRVIHDGAREAAPLLCLAAPIDEQVDRYAKFAERVPQTHELAGTALDLWLDHKQIQIAVGASVAARMGAEQDHARIASGGICKPPTGLLNHGLIDHGADKVARVAEVRSEPDFRVPKYVPNSAILDSTRLNQLDEIAPDRAGPGSKITFVMKGSPVQVRASAL